MDTFMDKLAQRLTAQEMIRANAAAEAEETNQLKNQVQEYQACLAQLQAVGRDLQARSQELQAANDKLSSLPEETINPQIEKLVDETIHPQIEKLVGETIHPQIEKLIDETINPQVEKLVEESTAKIREMRQSEQTLEELKGLLTEKLDTINEGVHKECVKVYRNVQAAIAEENGKQTELINKSVGSLAGKIKVVMGVSFASLVMALACLLFQILTFLKVL